MVSDLEHVITDRTIIMTMADVKAYMLMILRALAACHRCWILHRDIKPNNFLIAPDGTRVVVYKGPPCHVPAAFVRSSFCMQLPANTLSVGCLKLADFGLAKVCASPDRLYTNQVFAHWYRPPELLFGSKLYSTAVDVWAAGCVFAEMLLRRPWFAGNSEIEVLGKIFQVCALWGERGESCCSWCASWASDTCAPTNAGPGDAHGRHVAGDHLVAQFYEVFASSAQ